MLLADVVGFGKTPQALVAADALKAKRVLAVVKKSLMYDWAAGVQIWNRDKAYEVYTSTPLSSDRFTLTYYDALFNRAKNDKGKMVYELRPDIIGGGWDYIIADEATALKNRKTLRSKSMLKLSRRSPSTVLMTGTPIHNKPDELWHLLHILNPKEFSSYWRFVKDYCVTDTNYMGHQIVVGFKNGEQLAKILERYMIRRTVVDGITDPNHEVVRLRATPYQEKLYRQLVVQSMAELEKGVFLTALNPLVKHVRFRQLLCSPALVGGRDDSIKTQALIEFLAEYTPYTKVVVFSTLAEYLKLLEPKLKAFNPVMIIGEKTSAQREQALIAFKYDETCRVILTTMREGLNLQETSDTLVFMDKDWVPALVEQVVGRVNRRGQDKQVNVVTFIGVVPGIPTIDEYIEDIVLPGKRQYSNELELIYGYVELLRQGVGKTW